MTAPTFKRSPRAACPACGRYYQLSKGKLARHPEPPDPRSTVRLTGNCPGTGRRPEGSS